MGYEREGCVSRTRYVIDNGSFGRHDGFPLRISLINGKVSQRGLSVSQKTNVPFDFDEFRSNDALTYEYA